MCKEDVPSSYAKIESYWPLIKKKIDNQSITPFSQYCSILDILFALLFSYVMSPCVSAGKESACIVGDLGLIPWL